MDFTPILKGECLVTISSRLFSFAVTEPRVVSLTDISGKWANSEAALGGLQTALKLKSVPSVNVIASWFFQSSNYRYSFFVGTKGLGMG